MDILLWRADALFVLPVEGVMSSTSNGLQKHKPLIKMNYHYKDASFVFIFRSLEQGTRQPLLSEALTVTSTHKITLLRHKLYGGGREPRI